MDKKKFLFFKALSGSVFLRKNSIKLVLIFCFFAHFRVPFFFFQISWKVSNFNICTQFKLLQYNILTKRSIKICVI